MRGLLARHGVGGGGRVVGLLFQVALQLVIQRLVGEQPPRKVLVHGEELRHPDDSENVGVPQRRKKLDPAVEIRVAVDIVPHRRAHLFRGRQFRKNVVDIPY